MITFSGVGLSISNVRLFSRIRDLRRIVLPFLGSSELRERKMLPELCDLFLNIENSQQTCLPFFFGVGGGEVQNDLYTIIRTVQLKDSNSSSFRYRISINTFRTFYFPQLFRVFGLKLMVPDISGQ